MASEFVSWTTTKSVNFVFFLEATYPGNVRRSFFSTRPIIIAPRKHQCRSQPPGVVMSRPYDNNHWRVTFRLIILYPRVFRINLKVISLLLSQKGSPSPAITPVTVTFFVFCSSEKAHFVGHYDIRFCTYVTVTRDSDAFHVYCSVPSSYPLSMNVWNSK